MSSTLKPSLRQLCEFFSQIAEGKITGKEIQELIESPKSEILKKLLKKKKTVKKMTSFYAKNEALCNIVEGLSEIGAFEEARKTEYEITNDDDCNLRALKIIASFSHIHEDVSRAEIAEIRKSKRMEKDRYSGKLWG